MKRFLFFSFLLISTFCYSQELSKIQCNTAWVSDNDSLQQLEVIQPDGEYIGGGFGTNNDYNVQYNGEHSKYVFSNPVFYVGINQALGITPDRYVIIKFKEKKGNRIYTRFTSRLKVLNSDSEYTIPLVSKQINDNVYEFHPQKKLEKGEYGICFIFNCFPTFVYDFAIK